MTLKALILAAGRGKRLNEHTKEANKCMMKFGGKHLVEYSLTNAKKIGVEEIVIVVGYLAEQIINQFGNSYQGTPIKYVIQWEQKGLVHAIECCKEILKDSDFILLLGDEFICNAAYDELLDRFYNQNALVICGVVSVEDKNQIKKTYSILHDSSTNRVIRLIEKPRNPLNNLMGTGNCIFRKGIFDYIDMTPINQIRGEKELPDFIQCVIDDGQTVMYHIISSTYVNVNTQDDITIIGNKLNEFESDEDNNNNNIDNRGF